MAKRWMRGVSINTPGTTQNGVDHTPHLMLLYHFLTKLLGFTHVDEVVASGPTRTFANGHEATNTDGVLTSTDLTFSSASNPFALGDVGKFLVVLDPTNPENCGIYEIATYVGAGQVTIDFYVPGGTFPTAATGLTWWMFDTNNASYTPTSLGDYFVVQSPHATYPWTIKVTSRNVSNYIGAFIESSPNDAATSWDSTGHAWNGGARVLNSVDYGSYDRFFSDAPHSRIYAMGDTDGGFVLFWTDRNATSSVSAVMMTIVDPLETSPARSGNERFAIAGWNDVGGNSEVDRGDDFGGLGAGQVWEDYGNRYRVIKLMALIEERSSTDYFSRSIGVNARTGERDALPLMYSIEPEGETDFNRFAPHSKVPIGHIVMATANIVGELTPFDGDNYYHLRNGIVIPWNGLPQT